jgi:acyl-CoA hydrolase
VKELAEVWGKLPERERAKAMLDLTRDMPPRYRAVIEEYFRKLSQVEASK